MTLIRPEFPFVTEPLNVPWTVPPVPWTVGMDRMSRCAMQVAFLNRVVTLVTPSGQLRRRMLCLQGSADAPTFIRAAGVTRFLATLQTVPPTKTTATPLLWPKVRTALVALT